MSACSPSSQRSIRSTFRRELGAHADSPHVRTRRVALASCGALECCEPCLSRCVANCVMHPMLPVATISGSVAKTWSTFCSPSELGDFGLVDVVRPSRAATQMRVCDLADLGTRNQPQQLARFGSHALGIGQVTGIVVGDPQITTADRESAAIAESDPETPRRHRLCWQNCSARCSSPVPFRIKLYSCIPEPQPAALVTIASTSPGNAPDSVLANACACR